MRILIATDAWYPQVNGVVRTLSALAKAIEGFGARIDFLTPEGMPSVAMPSYPGIRLALPNPFKISRQINSMRPDAIHIATEGPIGHIVRWHCRARRRPFTTSFHTRFADYAVARWPIPEEAIWAWLRWFHNAGRGTMAATPSLADELSGRGFRSVMRWPRGVDSDLFRPRPKRDLGVKPPIFLTVGRLAVEKNLEAFLSLDLPGSKVVVGEGPARAQLTQRFPDAIFLGAKEGEELASIYASADVFVFPSRTDTFGLVLLEALSSGVPVASFPVPATRDVVGAAPVAVLDEDLRLACVQALNLSRADCLEYARTMTWEASAKCFLTNLTQSGVYPSREDFTGGGVSSQSTNQPHEMLEPRRARA